MYANWDKLANYQSIINLWIEKINRFMMKANVERHIILSPHSSGSPLSFNFKPLITPNNNNKYH